jgi:hypothetical protein
METAGGARRGGRFALAPAAGAAAEDWHSAAVDWHSAARWPSSPQRQHGACRKHASFAAARSVAPAGVSPGGSAGQSSSLRRPFVCVRAHVCAMCAHVCVCVCVHDMHVCVSVWVVCQCLCNLHF